MWLHFDCFSGVSGDMTLGALLDLGVSLDALRDGLALLDLSGYEIHAERRMVGVLDAVKLRVLLHPSHPPQQHEHHNHTHEHEHEHEHEHAHHNHTHEHAHHNHHHEHAHHNHHHEHDHHHTHEHDHPHGHDHHHEHSHGHSHGGAIDDGYHRSYADIRLMIDRSS